MALEQNLAAWLTVTRDSGINILQREFEGGPLHYFMQNGSGGASDFYTKVGKWKSWQAEQIEGLRSRIREPGSLISDAERLFEPLRLQRFEMYRQDRIDQFVGHLDLSNRARYDGGIGWIQLRQVLARVVLIPEWIFLTQSVVLELRGFHDRVVSLLPRLTLVGAVQEPSLQEALQALAPRTYVDGALVRSELATSEQHHRGGPQTWRDSAAALRRAIERLIDDAYQEATRRDPTLAGQGNNRRRQTDALGRGFVSREVAHQLYAAFSLLSAYGSHTGAALSESEMSQAWLSSRLAITLLSNALPA
jgi:hypothetical protein